MTGLKQHTGNWPGKTVSNAYGSFETEENIYTLVDIPGTYSLATHSREEEIAKNYLISKDADVVIAVCDATCLERNLNLVLQILNIHSNVIVCVNLMDEAKKKGISVDINKLSKALGVPVISTVARKKNTLKALCCQLDKSVKFPPENPLIIDNENQGLTIRESYGTNFITTAENIAKECVNEKCGYSSFDRKLDKIFTGKYTGYAIMLLLLGVCLWITVYGANYISEGLNLLFLKIETLIKKFLCILGAKENIQKIIIEGFWRVPSWIVAVMLPPMAIFFPLFTLLEDSGYLTRVAFNLDKPFKDCKSCGKQALTMCMGLGCNAAGVTGCRIIDSPRERLIAVLTNSFMPCNGRFPTIIALITMFFVTVSGFWNGVFSSVLLTMVIIFGIIMTFLVTRFLSDTFLKGVPSAYTLEMPSFRKPQFGKVIVRSIFDRTLFVLSRALVVAIPAGLVIFLSVNITIDGVPLFNIISDFLDPMARLIGLDGVILIAFILGFPANEIVVPIIIMGYLSNESLTQIPAINEMKDLFLANGWTINTAICTVLFSLLHWPCSTTLLTIKKETNSIKWTVIAFVLPTICGILLCGITTILFHIMG